MKRYQETELQTLLTSIVTNCYMFNNTNKFYFARVFLLQFSSPAFVCITSNYLLHLRASSGARGHNAMMAQNAAPGGRRGHWAMLARNAVPGGRRGQWGMLSRNSVPGGRRGHIAMQARNAVPGGRRGYRAMLARNAVPGGRRGHWAMLARNAAPAGGRGHSLGQGTKQFFNQSLHNVIANANPALKIFYSLYSIILGKMCVCMHVRPHASL